MPTPTTKTTLPPLVGVLAGVVGTLVFNPGSITEREARRISEDQAAVRAAAAAFETTALRVRWNLDQGQVGDAAAGFRQLEPLWITLEGALRDAWRNWRDFYNYDAEQLSALDRGQNEVVQLVKAARATWTPGTPALVVNLPAGDVRGFDLGVRDRPDEVDVRFLGDAILELRASPQGTRVLPRHNENGWGSTVNLQTDGTWSGRVWFENVTLLATGGSTLSTSSSWGNVNSRTPYKDVRLEGCTFLDHPLPTVRCVRPVSVNHAAISARRCRVNMPNSREHWIYSRNPYNAETWIEGNVVEAVGGNVLQYVSRPGEGPSYGRSTVNVLGNVFRGFHRCGDRAASAITIAGSGQDWNVQGNLVMDLDPPAFWNGSTGGALVAWDGGTFWSLEGQPVTGTHPLEMHANGRVRITGNVFVQPNSNRPVVTLQDAEAAEVTGNAIYGRNVELWQVGLGSLAWSGNDGQAQRDAALQAGAPPAALAIVPPMRARTGASLGTAAGVLTW